MEEFEIPRFSHRAGNLTTFPPATNSELYSSLKRSPGCTVGRNYGASTERLAPGRIASSHEGRTGKYCANGGRPKSAFLRVGRAGVASCEGNEDGTGGVVFTDANQNNFGARAQLQGSWEAGGEFGRSGFEILQRYVRFCFWD